MGGGGERGGRGRWWGEGGGWGWEWWGGGGGAGGGLTHGKSKIFVSMSAADRSTELNDEFGAWLSVHHQRQKRQEIMFVRPASVSYRDMSVCGWGGGEEGGNGRGRLWLDLAKVSDERG